MVLKKPADQTSPTQNYGGYQQSEVLADQRAKYPLEGCLWKEMVGTQPATQEGALRKAVEGRPALDLPCGSLPPHRRRLGVC